MKKTLNMLLVASLGGLIAIGVFKLLDKGENQSISEKQAVSFANMPVLADGEKLDFTQTSELVTPTVVHIISTVSAKKRLPSNEFDPFDFFGFPEPGPSQGSGSGVIISDDGYIATNNHVIEGASSIEVILNDKRSYRADLIGTDPQTDLALLKIEESGLSFLKFGNSDAVKVGEWVLAVGNPFNLTSTVTAGIVSAKGRNINLLRTADNQYAVENFIQTDAAVNPGNSGGALVNLRAELIGINTAIASRTGSYAGYSFAVPVNIVKKVMDDLLKYGSVQRGFLGVSIQDVDAKLAEDKKLSEIAGVYIAQVQPDGAAAKAGIKTGDVVLEVNKVKVNSSSELQEQVSRYHPGDEVELTFRRGGQIKSVKAKLKGQDGSTELKKREALNKAASMEGAEFSEITKEERQKYKIQHGAKLSKVGKGAFKDAGVSEGFIITKVDKQPIYSARDLSKRLADSEGSAVLIEGVDQQGNERVFGLKIGK